MRPTIRKQFQVYPGTYDDPCHGISQTVPDQSLSIRELLLNHSRGLPMPTAMREPQYLGVEIPTIYDLNDLIDNRERLEQVKNDINSELEALKKLEKEEKAKTPQEPPKPPKSPSTGEPPQEA